MARIRRKWTEEEDTILRRAVTKAQEDGRPLVWHEIAALIPGRTNKDCRKRWFGRSATKVNRGAWTAEENERLYNAVKQHGTKWSIVASVVETRTGDQCSKRWVHAINPEIDHSAWTPKEDQLLLEGVEKHGRNWQQIVTNNFPRRTSLAAKNRYHLLCRKSEGARTYSKSKVTTKAISDGHDNSAEIDQSQASSDSDEVDTDQDMDEDMDENYYEDENRHFSVSQELPWEQASSSDPWSSLAVNPLSSAFEPRLMNSVSSERPPATLDRPYYNMDENIPTVGYSPLWNVDFQNHMTLDTPNVQHQQYFRQTPANIPPIPSTTQTIDEFLTDFKPRDQTSPQINNQTLAFSTGLMFNHGSETLGVGHGQPPINRSSNLHRPPHLSLQTSSGPSDSSRQSTSNTGPPTPEKPPYSRMSSSPTIDQDSPNCGESCDTRRLTIQAVCSIEDLGKIVEAVTGLSVSAVFEVLE